MEDFFGDVLPELLDGLGRLPDLLEGELLLLALVGVLRDLDVDDEGEGWKSCGS